MILFTILSIIAVALVLLAIVVLCAGGVAFFTVFADLIVCAVLVALIIRFFVKRRH